MNNPLTPEQLTGELKKLEHWQEKNGWITTTFEFSDFMEAVDFVGALAELAEKRRHYPVVTLDRQFVIVELSTPTAGDKATMTDIDLAHAIEQISLDYDLAPEDPGFY